MLKKELRLNFKSRRKQFSAEEVFASGQSIGQLVRLLPVWDHNHFHIFFPIKNNNEIDTSAIINYLHSKNKQVFVPRVKEARELESILLLRESKLKENKWGIPEPTDGELVEPDLIDVVFVPLLIFDKKGHRVGYGKGYYDRFLKSCRKDVVKIGLSYFEAIDEIGDLNPGDIAMDYCVTPIKIYSF